jgi:citronellol/citronellal dehydrogenase
MTDGDQDTPHFGFSDAELAAQETVYASDLFAGRTVVVTGAGSGLGKAIAFLFARLGADLAICGRNPERLDAVRTLLEGFGGRVVAQSMSIREPEEVDAFFDLIGKELGPFDTLINNAGGQFPQMGIDHSVNGWNAVIDTNLNGTWYMMQAAARRWRDTGQGGNIVNVVADIWRGLPGMAHTTAARAGVIYLSKTVAVEWAPLDIRVNCVAPGCVETSAFGLYPPEGAATYYESNPMLRAGDAQDIAEACVYMAAATGKFITGETLTVDGGQQMWGDPWPPGRPDYFKLKS